MENDTEMPLDSEIVNDMAIAIPTGIGIGIGRDMDPVSIPVSKPIQAWTQKR